MTEQDAWDAVRAAVGEIAPDVDPADLAGGARLRQDLELDSMDFLRVLETIARRTGVDVPEDAYDEVATVGGLVGHLVAHG
ncbi:acyl carrier protein [Geodermatophilus sp. SYSU D00684]